MEDHQPPDNSLETQKPVPGFTGGSWWRIRTPLANLRDAPSGRRQRQLLLGARVRLTGDVLDGYGPLSAEHDGYTGYVALDRLGADSEVSHQVASRATHLYPEADFKAEELAALSFGAQLLVLDERPKFYETSAGFVPKKHLRPLDRPFTDPVTLAQMFFGTPYLWGGNSSAGIDCSGLIQAALRGCGIACPGDSGAQQAALGTDLAPATPWQRGDLLFWRGHVALVVDADTLIHANAHHMAVAYEPIARAIARIEAQGEGPVTAHKRL
jgi:cell wall-associated NlpC family hydrolase